MLYIYDYNHGTCIDTYIKNKLYKKVKKRDKPIKYTKTGKERKKYVQSNKNNEVHMFMDYLNANHDKLKKMYRDKTIIFICDRAYHSYELFHLLDFHEFRYIIRLKNNNLVNSTKETKNKNIIFFRKNARCIRYEVPLMVEYTDIISKKKKKCSMKAEYNLITNLVDKNKYNDNVIEKLYRIRWYIEQFFQFTKKNTKLGLSKEKNSNNHKIMRTCIAIVTILLKFMIHIYIHSVKFKKKYKTFFNSDCLKKINYSYLIDGVYTKFLTFLIKKKYNKDKIINFMDIFFATQTNKENRSSPRESLLPFSKWYIKKYHKKYDMDQILSAILNDTIDELHKNLQKKAKSFRKVFMIDNLDVP